MSQRPKSRKEVNPKDTWDLSSLFENDKGWEIAFALWSKDIEVYQKYKGTLGKSAKHLKSFFEFDRDIERKGERLGNYAFLKATEDEGEARYQRMKGRFEHVAVRQSELSSFVRPEILSISEKKINTFLSSPFLGEWHLLIERIIRFKPHSLGAFEENLLALQGQMNGAASAIFNQLNDVDLQWGTVADEKGMATEINHSTYGLLLRSPIRSVRKDAFYSYFKAYDDHKNTIAAIYNASVQKDVYYAKARKYPGPLEQALFADNIKISTYDTLIAMVHVMLPDLYRYIKIRKQKLKIKDTHQYDTYVPLFAESNKNYEWDEAVALTIKAVKPLGREYVETLQKGLTTDRWCDRYQNIGKHSGAFSSSSYDSKPYILMNYQPEILDHVFTLAHEVGHSMHSYYANKNQPFQYAGYTIFTAEIASTFNEQLLLEHMLKDADKKQKICLLTHAIDSIRMTIIRQVMFAEFEKRTHELALKGEPLTVEVLRKEYRMLLEVYFGPDFVIDPELELECLRIPHFYRAFYVYKYATGLISSIALSNKVLKGTDKEKERAIEAYLNMLRAGGSDWPLALLRAAGLDLGKKESLASVVTHFKNLIDQLERSV